MRQLEQRWRRRTGFHGEQPREYRRRIFIYTNRASPRQHEPSQTHTKFLYHRFAADLIRRLRSFNTRRFRCSVPALSSAAFKCALSWLTTTTVRALRRATGARRLRRALTRQVDDEGIATAGRRRRHIQPGCRASVSARGGWSEAEQFADLRVNSDATTVHNVSNAGDQRRIKFRVSAPAAFPRGVQIRPAAACGARPRRLRTGSSWHGVLSAQRLMRSRLDGAQPCCC